CASGTWPRMDGGGSARSSTGAKESGSTGTSRPATRRSLDPSTTGGGTPPVSWPPPRRRHQSRQWGLSRAGSHWLFADPCLMPAGGATTPSIGHHVAHELTDGPVISFWLLHGGGRSASPWLSPPGDLVVPGDTVNAELAAATDTSCLVRVDHDREVRKIAGM